MFSAKKRKKKQTKPKAVAKDNLTENTNENSSDEEFALETDNSDDEFEMEEERNTPKKIKGASKMNEDGTWEDIYGRLREKDGTVVTEVSNFSIAIRLIFIY